MRTLLGVFIILHGLVHLWYVALSMRWVAFRPEMGWSGESWLLRSSQGGSTSRLLAALMYGVASLGLLVGGAGVLLLFDWYRPVLLFSAALSLAAIVTFWDGNSSKIIEKGAIGAVINVLTILGLLVL